MDAVMTLRHAAIARTTSARRRRCCNNDICACDCKSLDTNLDANTHAPACKHAHTCVKTCAELQKQLLLQWQQHLKWQQAVDFRLSRLDSTVTGGSRAPSPMCLQMQECCQCSTYCKSTARWNATVSQEAPSHAHLCHFLIPARSWTHGSIAAAGRTGHANARAFLTTPRERTRSHSSSIYHDHYGIQVRRDRRESSALGDLLTPLGLPGSHVPSISHLPSICHIVYVQLQRNRFTSSK